MKEGNERDQFRYEISPNEKRELKSQIFKSIRGLKRKKRIQFFGAIAASVTLLVCLSFLVFLNSGIDQIPSEYQAALDTNFDENANVVLRLSENENVVITQENSVIQYSSNDTDIKIGASQTIKRNEKQENKFNTLLVPYGKRAEIILADGTKVWLNSGSKLVYPSLFSGSKREVFLIGEAIFEVSENKDVPFYVSTNDYSVKVLGTVFNVANYPEDSNTSTVLKSGKVQIDYQTKGLFGSKKSIDITPGTKVVYERGIQKISTSAVSIESYFSWRDGILIFKNDPLDHILKKVSRYYNVEVVIENESLRLGSFSGHLNLKDDISQVIEIINESIDQNLTLRKEEGSKKIFLN
jgi:hypothetical protein